MTEPNDIRPLEWRDLPLLHRLRERGLCLDARVAFTRGPRPLQTALLDAITPGHGEFTLVVRRDGGEGAVGQVSHHIRDAGAHLAFIGPADVFERDHVLGLLDALTRVVGRRGASHLSAEVDSAGPAFTTLRKVGFAVYARQRIWRLAAEQVPAAPDEGRWQPKHRDDEPAITRLYLNIVPGLVQQVEPPPSGQGLVHWHKAELHAYLDMAEGPRGTWVQPYLHPAAQEHEQLLASAFAQLSARTSAPLYVCVRSYQGWMNNTLDHMGLENCVDQAVMVKRIAANVKLPSHSVLKQLDATRPEPSAPFAPTHSETHAMSRMDRLKS